MEISAHGPPLSKRLGKRKLKNSRRNGAQKLLSAYSRILALASSDPLQKPPASEKNRYPRIHANKSKRKPVSETNSSGSTAGNTNPADLLNCTERAESVQSVKNRISLPSRPSKITKSALRVVRDASKYVRRTLKALAVRDSKIVQQLHLQPTLRKRGEEENNDRKIVHEAFSSHEKRDEKKSKVGPTNEDGKLCVRDDVKESRASSPSTLEVGPPQNACTSHTKRSQGGRKECVLLKRRVVPLKPGRKCNIRRRDASDVNKKKIGNHKVTNHGAARETGVSEGKGARRERDASGERGASREKGEIGEARAVEAKAVPSASASRKRVEEQNKSVRLKVPSKDVKWTRKCKIEDHKSDVNSTALSDGTNRASSPLVLPQSFNPSAKQGNSKHLVSSGHDRLEPEVDGDEAFEKALAVIISRTRKIEKDKLSKKEEKKLQAMAASQVQSCQWERVYDSVLKQVPGNSMKECMNKFYSRESTPVRSTKIDAQQEVQKNQPVVPALMQGTAGTSSKTSRHGPVKGIAFNKSQEKRLKRNHFDRPAPVTEHAGRCVSDTKTRTSPNESVGNEGNRVGDEDACQREGSGEATVGESCLAESLANEKQDARLDRPSDKENRQPMGVNTTTSNEGLAQRVLPIKEITINLNSVPVKDSGHVINCTTVSTRPRIMSSIYRRKPGHSAGSVIYLHSKDALDFDNASLDSIKLARDVELPNVRLTDGYVHGTNSFGVEKCDRSTIGEIV